MNRITALKYLSVLSLPALAWVAFHYTGWWTFLPLLEAFGLIPVLELLFRPDAKNLIADEEDIRKDDRLYDWLIYLVVPAQLYLLWVFLNTVALSPDLITLAGRVSAMGLLCGVMGINVAHELGHRSTWYEQAMAKVLLLTSLYMHFFIEHNRGHHKHVSTEDDPSSARRGESLYAFWLRSVVGSYFSAWRLEKERLSRKNLPLWTWQNEMLRFQVVQGLLLVVIFAWFGVMVLVCFVVAAVLGFLLLESVNYIEHYGLQREKTKSGAYERVMPTHSWNSNHMLGRIMLFELSRHSDHHYIASRKYQILRHLDESPQMPTGYPGMMLMATVPPLWFWVMNNRLDRLRKTISD